AAERLGRALQAVVRRVVEPHREEVYEARIRGHLVEALDVPGSRREQVANTAPCRTRLDLRVELRRRWELLRRRRRLRGDRVVQTRAHVLLERVGLGFIAQQAHGGRSTQTGDEHSAIDFHGAYPSSHS